MAAAIGWVVLAAGAMLATRLPAQPVWAAVAVAACAAWLVLGVAALRPVRTVWKTCAAASGVAGLAVPVAAEPWIPVPAPIVAVLVLAAIAGIFPRPHQDAPAIGAGKVRRRWPVWLVAFIAIPIMIGLWGPDRIARLGELPTAGPVILALLLLAVATGLHLIRRRSV